MLRSVHPYHALATHLHMENLAPALQQLLSDQDNQLWIALNMKPSPTNCKSLNTLALTPTCSDHVLESAKAVAEKEFNSESSK